MEKRLVIPSPSSSGVETGVAVEPRPGPANWGEVNEQLKDEGWTRHRRRAFIATAKKGKPPVKKQRRKK